MSATAYLYIGLLIYACLVLYVGFIGAKRIKGLSDFAIAGQSMGPIPLGLAFTATFFSAAAFLGYVGFAYAWGQSTLWIFVAIFGGSTLGLIVIAKGVRQTNINLKALSLPDWIGGMYKSDLMRALVALIIMIQIYYVAGQFAAGGTLLSGMLGIDYVTGIVVVTAITVVYLTLGGLFADVYTSIFQTILMMTAGLIVFVSGFFFFQGGLTEVSARLGEMNPNFIACVNPDSLHFYSWATIFGIILVEFAFAGQPQLLTKLLALKDPKDTKVLIWTWIVSSFICMLVIFGGLYMLVLDPNLPLADYAVVEYAKRYFHPIVSTILAVAIVAALMSTACGLLLVMTTCIANDLFLRTLVKNKIINMEQEKAEKLAYGMTKFLPAVFGLICLYLAYSPPKYMGVMVWIGISGVAAATLSPMIFALLWRKRATTAGAIVGLIVGEGTYVFLYMITNIEKSVMAAGAWGVCASFVAMYVVSLFVKESSIDVS